MIIKKTSNNLSKKKIIVIGAGNSGHIIKEAIQGNNFYAFIDNLKKNKQVIGSIKKIKQYNKFDFIISYAGDVELRKKTYEILKKNKLNLCNSIFEKNVSISKNAEIKKGCFIQDFSKISINSSIGENVYIEVSCTVGSNSKIGKNSVLTNSVNLTNNVIIGENCYVGTGVSVLPNIKVGNNVKIFAGEIVKVNIPNNSIFYKNKIIKNA